LRIPLRFNLRLVALLSLILGGLIGMVSLAPAAWMATITKKISSNRLTLTQTSGTLWNGEGTLFVLTPQISHFEIGEETRLNPTPRSHPFDHGFYVTTRFRWQLGISFHSNLLPSLTLSVLNECCMQEAMSVELRPSFRSLASFGLEANHSQNQGDKQNVINFFDLFESPLPSSLIDNFTVQVQISDSHSQWPTDWLAALGSPWNTLAPRGDLEIQTKKVNLIFHPLSNEPMHLLGQTIVVIKDLSSQLSTLSPLGSYKVELSQPYESKHLDIADMGTPTSPLQHSNLCFLLKLSTIEGHLELSGEGDWSNEHLHFNGLARAAPGFEAALANLLGVLGPRNDNISTLKIGFYEKKSQYIKA
jgi:general secretion pathway protein N